MQAILKLQKEFAYILNTFAWLFISLKEKVSTYIWYTYFLMPTELMQNWDELSFWKNCTVAITSQKKKKKNFYDVQFIYIYMYTFLKKMQVFYMHARITAKNIEIKKFLACGNPW